MAEHVTPKEAIGHVLDAFDDALLRCGGGDAVVIELTYLLHRHAATRIPHDPPLTATSILWTNYAKEEMKASEDTVALITAVVDKSGVIRPMSVTKGLPDTVDITLRAAVTDILSAACSCIFKRKFRCVCRDCTAGRAKELHDAIAAGRVGWSPTKAEA